MVITLFFQTIIVYATSEYSSKAKVNTKSNISLNVRSTPVWKSKNLLGEFSNDSLISYNPKTLLNGYVRVKGLDSKTGQSIEGWSAIKYISQYVPPTEPTHTNIPEDIPLQYKEQVLALKSIYPNWNFKFYDAGLSLNSAIDLQYNMNQPVPKIDISQYKETDKTIINNRISLLKNSIKTKSLTYDKLYKTYLTEGNFFLPKKSAVGYYMNPVNFLNDSSIFQFLELKFNDSIHNLDSIKTIFSNTYFSKDPNNYALWFYNASKNNDINPYFLISKAIVEGGAYKIDSSNTLLTGFKSGNSTYYNFFGINAKDGNSSESAKKYAIDNDWSSPEKAINGGAQYISERYINEGQDTFYTLRYNLTGNSGYLKTSTFSHQYASNIADANTKSLVFSKQFKSILTKSDLVFNIPIYK